MGIITVKTLWDEGAKALSLTVIAGEQYLDRKLPETAMNRPGLALTGFFQYFANQRLQIFGLAEFTYLKSLSDKDKNKRLTELFEQQIPGVVVTRNRKVPPEIIDLAEQYKVPVMRTPMVTMNFVNECTVILEKLTAPQERIQGTTMELMGIGVLLRGDPGIGKSETALSLIERGYSLVSDDVTEVRRTSRGRLVSWASEVTRYHMEIRGLGIIHVPSLFGVAAIRRQTELDLVIDLKKPTGNEDRTGIYPEMVEILGVEIPCITLPVRSGRDMANIVEVAALNQKLKELGHDAAKELDDKIIDRLTRGRVRHG
ncbi:HPr(Ser) kinase/phosphatase [Pontiella sulfatireligans]|uniref:HPr kinase/phosphorylase n=1 Tax=Pontiella sulfatireligans TaxID=2750658 RepID=A0A6C2USV6_9BACT|nr:HPr(Ser) kinase/phosphatase [Pontiella sulfatireligans]VGO23412.1 HPr kinase/phosphorylase [Pontiella sulfatireligans]